MREAHVLQIVFPNSDPEYIPYESAEKARGAAFDALQRGVLIYDAHTGEEQVDVPQGTMFKIMPRDSLTMELGYKSCSTLKVVI